jgi:hypothetical protein
MLHRGIVFVNCALGITSLYIQIKILVPWHDVISLQVDSLEQQQKKLENRLVDMQEQLKQPNAKVTKSSGWFW